MSSPREIMQAAEVGKTAIDVFESQVEQVRAGGSGMIHEADITPYESPDLPDGEPTDADREALDATAVIRLNGGLGTSMGMDRAKSLLPVRGDLSFLDIMVRQILHLREETGARLPLTFLHSFRTSADSLAALEATPQIVSSDVPIELYQNKVPKLLADTLAPVSWADDPELEWCPPGHGDIYAVMHDAGFLDLLQQHGYRQVMIANSDNLGAVPDATMAGWFAGTGAPFALEAVRRNKSDRKGGHFAHRNADGRLILRETAQTPPDEAGDIGRHPYSSTNNLWFDIERMQHELRARDGNLALPVIVNRKTVDPTDGQSPTVVQLETAMGAAIEVFDGATTVTVTRERFIPVKTTNDLLLVRSDCYALGDDFRMNRQTETMPFVELSGHYKTVADFDARFPAGPPSMVGASSLVVRGDWTFGEGVTVVGDVELGPEGGRIPDGETLGG